MFTYSELMELEDLCKEDRRFEKYVERLKDENNLLLTKITHELGNPLTIIYSTLQLMESKEPEIKEKKYWNQLRHDIKDLSSLLKDYSDYNTCDSLNLHDENIFEILQTVNKSFEPILMHKGINFSFQISGSMLPLMSSYKCDKIKLKQVFINIIKNGMEALGSNGTIWIKVPDKNSEIEDMIQGESCLIVQIGNDGTPIPQNELNGMFSPIISNKNGGCGIGLTISNRIIEAHGGMIFVNSDDTATNFTICLPL